MNAFKLYSNGRMASASLSPLDVITGETLRSTGPMSWAPYWRGGNLAYSTFSPYGYSGTVYYGKVAYNW